MLSMKMENMIAQTPASSSRIALHNVYIHRVIQQNIMQSSKIGLDEKRQLDSLTRDREPGIKMIHYHHYAM